MHICQRLYVSYIRINIKNVNTHAYICEQLSVYIRRTYSSINSAVHTETDIDTDTDTDTRHRHRHMLRSACDDLLIRQYAYICIYMYIYLYIYT